VDVNYLFLVIFEICVLAGSWWNKHVFFLEEETISEVKIYFPLKIRLSLYITIYYVYSNHWEMISSDQRGREDAPESVMENRW